MHMTSLVAQMVKRLSTMWETWVQSLGQEVPWRRKWHPLQYSCLENPVDGGAWCPWGHKELDTTEQLHFYFNLDFGASCLPELSGKHTQAAQPLTFGPVGCYARERKPVVT